MKRLLQLVLLVLAMATIARAQGSVQLIDRFGNPVFITSNSLDVTCVSGCTAAATFTDNSTFTVGGSAINVIGGYYTTGAAPTLSSGNAARARIDANSYLDVDCIVGCSASAGFADNSAFTASTTPIGITGGWYSTSPTNCTTGNACAATADRGPQAIRGRVPGHVPLGSVAHFHHNHWDRCGDSVYVPLGRQHYADWRIGIRSRTATRSRIRPCGPNSRADIDTYSSCRDHELRARNRRQSRYDSYEHKQDPVARPSARGVFGTRPY